MKKNKRVGMLVDELTSNPSRLFESRHFCEKYDIAKSSLSEDIRLANEILYANGSGHIESISGVGGGIRFIPGISDEQISELQQNLIEMLSDRSRMLGGGFLYTSDIMFDGSLVHDMARIFAQQFAGRGADYIVTVETKGIALAAQTAFMLHLPLVVIRREARYSEGSTVSINYFSGSAERIQKMSIAKRAVKPGTRAVVIDDFMRGGGSLKGVVEILGEFEIEVVGMGVALGSLEPERKKVEDYTPIVIIDEIDEENKRITISANEALKSGE
ncbi:MAG: pur operon repressor [Mogibacterium sp.]|nr:pur operon repressor [Mogibacterium sp.]